MTVYFLILGVCFSILACCRRSVDREQEEKDEIDQLEWLEAQKGKPDATDEFVKKINKGISRLNQYTKQQRTSHDSLRKQMRCCHQSPLRVKRHLQSRRSNKRPLSQSQRRKVEKERGQNMNDLGADSLRKNNWIS